MAAEATKKGNMKYIHFAIVLALMFLFRFIPPIGSITSYGMAVIGIFLGLIYGWSVDADNLIWPSILSIVALGVTDYGTCATSLASLFNNETIMLVLMSMFFIGMLQDSHLTEWMANKILGAKFVVGRPWIFTAFIILIPSVITILVNQVMVSLIMFVVYQSIFEQAGYKKGDLYPAMVLMGFMISSCMFLSLFPFRGWCLMTVGMATKAGITINMGGWIIAVTISSVVASIGWILVMFLVPGCRVDKIKDIDLSQFQKESAPLTKHQKAVLAIVVADLVGCVVVTFAAGTEGIWLFIKNLGIYGWVVFLIAFAMIWKVDDKPVLDKKKAPSFFYWDLILVIASALLIAGQITSTTTGITTMISSLIAPLFGMPSYVFLLGLGVITFIVTNFANNVATTVTMLTIAMTMAAKLDFNLQVAMMVITVFGIIGLFTPAGSAYGAMIHAHDFTTAKSSYIAGAIMLVYLIIIMAVVVIPLGLQFMS